jgi:hypothetical protein
VKTTTAIFTKCMFVIVHVLKSKCGPTRESIPILRVVMSLSRLTEVLHRLNEAKELFWHGTSSNRLKSILSQGFNPTIKDELKQYGKHAGSIASFEGTYFSKNALTASSNATTVARYENAYEAVIEVVLETRSVLYDEDSLPLIEDVLDTACYKHLGRSFDQYTASSLLRDAGSELLSDVIDSAVEEWRRRVALWGEEKDKRRLDPLNSLLKEWASLVIDFYSERGRSLRRNEPEAIRKVRGRVYSKLRGIPAYYRQGDFSYKVRATQPVGFSGANRIVAAYIIIPPKIVRGELLTTSHIILVYGEKVSEEFLAQFEERIGPYDLHKIPFREWEKDPLAFAKGDKSYTIKGQPPHGTAEAG